MARSLASHVVSTFVNDGSWAAFIKSYKCSIEHADEYV